MLQRSIDRHVTARILPAVAPHCVLLCLGSRASAKHSPKKATTVVSQAVHSPTALSTGLIDIEAFGLKLLTQAECLSQYFGTVLADWNATFATAQQNAASQAAWATCYMVRLSARLDSLLQGRAG